MTLTCGHEVTWSPANGLPMAFVCSRDAGHDGKHAYADLRWTSDDDLVVLGPFALRRMLLCRQCEPPLPMPFDSEQERGQWASRHTAGSGHSQFRVWSER